VEQTLVEGLKLTTLNRSNLTRGNRTHSSNENAPSVGGSLTGHVAAGLEKNTRYDKMETSFVLV